VTELLVVLVTGLPAKMLAWSNCEQPAMELVHVAPSSSVNDITEHLAAPSRSSTKYRPVWGSR